MLTDADKNGQARHAIKAIDDLELELLEMVGLEIADLRDFERYTVARKLGKVAMGATDIVHKSRQGLMNAVRIDLQRDFDINGANEARIASNAGRKLPSDQMKQIAVAESQKAFREVSPVIESLLMGIMSGTSNAYVLACERAAMQVSSLGTRDAMKNAVGYLANKGITAYSYTRKDGVEVHVPIDVGIKRAIVNAGQRGRMAQTLQIAQMADHDLVEVNTTANARQSHAEWQGQIYSLSGSSSKYKPFNESCNVGDPVDGIGGYNCGHEVALYYEGYSRTFDNPLAGTGYSTEQVRNLTNKQRALERDVRAAKREATTLKACGFSATEANAKARNAQASLRTLIDDNKAVLTRDRSREQLYGS